MENKNNNIKIEPLSMIISDCFSRYAKYVIQDRALPDIRDGLKPVQRRILYAMNELGLHFNKQYKKSARTVGEVIGKYHPHGDSSIYEAMVRMSQDWKNNLPLLDMHGNNGSIDGDSAAAMRYTESRLSEIACIMLDNIKKDTVEFTFNFDDTEKEPTVLPSLFPNLLINGCFGIAAGYATTVPTHNPKEIFDGIIHRINYPDCRLDTIMKIIPGPDFPTGGIIYNENGIEESFKTGKGKFIISSKIEFNTINSKLDQIIIKEIPYDTNKSTIIKELTQLVYNENVSGILDIRDESDKNGVSIVIDVKKDKNLELIKNYLLKNTKLQVAYSTNFVAILNKKPTLVPLLLALDSYIEYAISIIVKTAKYDLEKALKRAEILHGLIRAIDIIDEIITLIRKSQSKEDAKNKLIEIYSFTPNQAEAIVTLKLYSLTRTDISDLRLEVEEINKKIKYYRELISSEKLQKQVLVQKLKQFKDQFGYPRKTKIVDQIQKIEIEAVDMLESKEVILGVSVDGYLKQLTRKVYESNQMSEYAIKPGDNLMYFAETKNTNYLVMITRFGKIISIPIYKIQSGKWKDVGQHINDFITLEPNDKIVYANSFLTIPENVELVMMSKLGLVKRVNLAENLNLKSKSSTIWKAKNDDYLIGAKEIKQNIHEFITCLTKNSYGLTFSTAEIPLLSRTSTGVKGIKLQIGDECVGFVLSKTLQPLAYTATNKSFKFIKLEDIEIKKRYSKPEQVLKNLKEKLICFEKFNTNKLNILSQNKINLYEFEIEKIKSFLNAFIKLDGINEITDIKNNQMFPNEIVENLAKAKYTPYIPTSDEIGSDNDEEENNSQIGLLD